MGIVAVNAVFVACAIPLSIILPKINARLLLLVLFLFGIALCLGLANSGNNWTLVFILTGCAGLGIGGQQIVLNYMVAQAYPTALRATATGWAIALGRVGAIIGSASGGWFLEHGGPAGYYSALIIPLAIAAAGLMIIRSQPGAVEGFQLIGILSPRLLLRDKKRVNGEEINRRVRKTLGSNST